ncbi:MAG: hypothetical protein A2X25_11390 [Chloroflexi bacterium GWB2_49_20]|nr:MAG: hypothetical protein A2X25_11390 [Chloroflexi bacterium GWB2_49_20]OGN77614.1 MAG: hypothetical protein A2X26_09660 [Chloroflexi bacterium GWC2_49_37]OGN86390.1 MAG: hypothetical protein A2X27_05815 [Chloroflexi bacterium GWD2_49_16]HBG74628.1 hypothetical protein [Anaerolineae bacterium]
MHTCLNCNRSENEMPLINLQYKGEKLYICSGCMPVLLHSPAKLAGKLPDAEKIQPAHHDH